MSPAATEAAQFFEQGHKFRLEIDGPKVGLACQAATQKQWSSISAALFPCT